MKRPEIYSIIDGERFYQDNLWGDLDTRNNISDFILYMENYLQKAKQTNNPDQHDQSLDALRKVVALGIACFEKFGVPSRQ